MAVYVGFAFPYHGAKPKVCCVSPRKDQTMVDLTPSIRRPLLFPLPCVRKERSRPRGSRARERKRTKSFRDYIVAFIWMLLSDRLACRRETRYPILPQRRLTTHKAHAILLFKIPTVDYKPLLTYQIILPFQSRGAQQSTCLLAARLARAIFKLLLLFSSSPSSSC